MAVDRIHLIYVCMAICSLSKSVLSNFKECKKTDSCRCSTDEGEIDLRKLAGTDGKPRFSQISSNVSNFQFSWNPCGSFSLTGTACNDVAACLKVQGGKIAFYGIAKQETAECVLSKNGDCALKYTGKAFNRKSVFSVELQCNKELEGQVDPVNANNITNTYETVLHSKYACPSAVTPSRSDDSAGLSKGSIVVIAFSCLLVIYIACGILVNKYARHKEGKEVFPNYSFWADFPFLIKDGCVFSFQSLKKLGKKGRSRKGYTPPSWNWK